MGTNGSNGDIPLRQRFATAEGLRLEPSQSVGTQTPVSHTAGETALLLHVTDKLRGLHWVYARSAEHYTSLHWGLSVPTIASTAVTGVLGFMSNNDPAQKASLGVAIGVLGAVGGIAQGMLAAFGFEARAARDRQAADAYEDLLTRCSFELAHPDEPNFYKDIEASLLEINKKTQPPPQWLVDRYARDKPTVALPV